MYTPCGTCPHFAGRDCRLARRPVTDLPACPLGLWAATGSVLTVTRPAPPARPRICLYAERIEHKAGCGGFNCRHVCRIGGSDEPPAVKAAVRAYLGDSDVVLPSDECQTCEGYRARPRGGSGMGAGHHSPPAEATGPP